MHHERRAEIRGPPFVLRFRFAKVFFYFPRERNQGNKVKEARNKRAERYISSIENDGGGKRETGKSGGSGNRVREEDDQSNDATRGKKKVCHVPFVCNFCLALVRQVFLLDVKLWTRWRKTKGRTCFRASWQA